MDPSLPVLVTRLPDRKALARLVRVALRHEIAHVVLSEAPQRTQPHTLDLRVADRLTLSLLAEPAGAPQNGQFPLRLRPLHRAQAAELYQLLESENVMMHASDAPPAAPVSSVPPDTTADEPRTLAFGPDSAALMRNMSTGAPAPEAKVIVNDPRRTVPMGTGNLAQQVVPNPRKTAPLGGSWPKVPGMDAKADAPASTPKRASKPVTPLMDPRRTVPTDQWEKMAREARRIAAEADAMRAAPSLPPSTDAEEPNRWFAQQQAEEVAKVAPSRVFGEEPTSSLPVSSDPPDRTIAMDGMTFDGEPSPPTSQDPPVASSRSDDAFFDDALANLPQLTLDETEAFAKTEAPPPVPVVADDEATLIRVPQSQSTASASAPRPLPAAGMPASFDDDDDAKDSERGIIVAAPDARGEELTLTPTEAKVPLPRKKATKLPKEERRPKTTQTGETNPSLIAPAAGAVDPLVGRKIADGKYVIESLIGAGAAGAVYRATHRELRRTVAVKVLHPIYQQDPHFMKSFRGEALAASQLDHPNVMRVLDFGQEASDSLVYIVMEHLSGRTLQSLLDEERRLPPDRALEIMIQVCAALSIAHDNGIIHRDIKPDNIMLVPSRNDEGSTFELVKVCDFGIAALQNARAGDDEISVMEGGVIAGTPEYMSPEQARGEEVDARADVYACGICMYELVTGRPPFLGETAPEILLKQVQETPRPPSQLIKGLDPLLEETILRAILKDPERRQQTARELRVELKELLDPVDRDAPDDQDERSLVENVPGLDDPASGFPGFFILLSSAVTRVGRFERGHPEVALAMKDLVKAVRGALRGRSELTFARRDTPTRVGFCVMSGHAEIVDLKRLLGSQLYGSHGVPFVEALVKHGIAALTLREGLPDAELQYAVEMLQGSVSHEDLRKELFTKPLRNVSVLFVSDVIGRDRKLSWKVGLTAARLARDLKALSAVRGISLKKMREARDDLVTGVAHLLTKGEEVRQFLFNADLVDDAVANLRGFSAFQVWPLVLERILHDAAAEATRLLLDDLEKGEIDRNILKGHLEAFAKRLVTERSATSDEVVAELHRRGIVAEADLPRDLVEAIRARTLAEALIRDPVPFLRTLDMLRDPADYEHELATLEAAMAVLARRGEAVALFAALSLLARHATGQSSTGGPRENVAKATMKSIIDKQRLVPIANLIFNGAPHQRDAARQILVLAGSPGAHALFIAREGLLDLSQRPAFVQVFRETGPAGWALLSAVLPQMLVQNDTDVALVEDLLRTMPDRPDPVLADAAGKFLGHPKLAPVALTAVVPLLGERARMTLLEALELADEPTRIVAVTELRRLRAIDEPVCAAFERIIAARGGVGDDLRAAAASALADAPPLVRPRVVAAFVKAVEGRRGVMALLRGNNTVDETPLVTEAMARALLVLDRQEGIRVLKARIGRAEGPMKARLAAILQQA